MGGILIFVIIISVIIMITVIGFITSTSIDHDDGTKEKLPPHHTKLSSRDDIALFEVLEAEKSNIVGDIKEIIVQYKWTPFNSIDKIQLDEFIHEYTTNAVVKLPTQFNDWEKNHQNLINLCCFGIQLLQLYEDTKSTVYDETAVIIITMISKKVDDILEFYDTNPSESKIHGSISFASLLVAYEYIGNNETVKAWICHDLIDKIIPTIDHGTKTNLYHIYSLQFAVIRLLSDYLYDFHNAFIKDVQFILKGKSILPLNIIVNESDDIKRGVYQDGSCISATSIPSYEYLQSYFTSIHFHLYEDLFGIFFPTFGNLSITVKNITKKLCHPHLPYVPFGLFDADGSTVRTNWWDMDGWNGIYILPFIGMGVYKRNQVVFSVRVQRPHMAACQLDSKKTGDFILGSIQLRRIYLNYRLYPHKLTWKELINEPGIISIANDSKLPMNFLTSTNLKSNSYVCDDIDSNNFVAFIPDGSGMLVWYNKYKCTLIHSTITEVGLFTRHGLSSFYIIHNHGPNVVQFRTQGETFDRDIESVDRRRQLIYTSQPESVDGFVKFPPAEPTPFSWAVLFNKSKETNIDYNDELKLITFDFGRYSYKIFMEDESRYIIKRNDGITWAGSSSSLLNHSMEINGNRFVRDPVTLMYSQR